MNKITLDVFQAIAARTDDDLPSPASCQKRASVAVIVAFFPSQPSKDDTAQHHSSIDSLGSDLEHSQNVPHILFIRRAARASDRWSSHIALPGGRREAGESDLDAAIRETMEEVSLDISEEAAFCAGSLGQRLVTSRLGTVQLLTLCPYLFLLKQVGRAPILTGQASEVHACHWVPLTHLLDPRNATKEYVDVSNRLVGGEKLINPRISKVLQKLMRSLTGSLAFSGIALKSSLSIYSTPDAPTPEAERLLGSNDPRMTNISVSNTDSKEEKMILWGLTQAVMLDFLDFFPQSQVRDNWQYPTFSMPDIAFVLYLLNYNNRSRNARKSHNYLALTKSVTSRTSLDWVGQAMEGYYAQIRRGIVITMVIRLTFLAYIAKRIIYKSRLT